MISGLITKFTTFGLLGLPTWYEYLPKQSDGTPKVTGLADVWLIVAAVVEILLRIAGLAAVIMVIYGGVSFILSHGEPEAYKKARTITINGVIGLLIAVGAATLVTFIAGQFNGS